jgi:secreted trypsin-like serine protease
MPGAYRHAGAAIADAPAPGRQACTRANPTAVDTGVLHIPHLLCAGGEYGKDSCVGDSGGPLSVFRGGREWLVAVLSLGSEIPTWTDNCAVTGRYGVYTRTDVYANWIQSTLSVRPMQDVLKHQQKRESERRDAPSYRARQCMHAAERVGGISQGQRFGCSCSSRADPCSGGASLIVAPSDDCPTANSAPAACFGPASIVTALMLLWILLAQ